MKYIFVIFMSLFIVSCSSTKETISNRLLIAKTTVGRAINSEDLHASKFYAAAALTCKLSGKYELLDQSYTDSLANLFKIKDKNASTLNIAKSANASEILFIKSDRIKNILRTEVVTVNTNDTNKVSRGHGYSALRHRSEKTNQLIYDTALLSSFQRAFAVAEKDSFMFDSLQNGFRIKPVPTVSITGIEFINNSSVRAWDIFSDKLITSFAAVESVFDSIKYTYNYVVIDTETRDSIYNIFGLFIPENYNPPNKNEIDALKKFDIDFFITGKTIRTENGANLSLSLISIDPKTEKLNIIKTEEESIFEDSKSAFYGAFGRLGKKLIDGI